MLEAADHRLSIVDRRSTMQIKSSLDLPTQVSVSNTERPRDVGGDRRLGTGRNATTGFLCATIAIAHNVPVIAYCILRDGTGYRDLGPD